MPRLYSPNATTAAATVTVAPAPRIDARGPARAISGPPTSMPKVLAPVTTVACAVRAARRSRPEHDRVTMAVVAALPAGTASPMTPAATAITGRVGTAPMANHPTPATTQDRLFTNAGRELDAVSMPSADPAIAPPEYDASPTVARSTPDPSRCPSTVRHNVKANHAAQPSPRTVQPTPIS